MCIYINRGKEFVAVVNVFPGYAYHKPVMVRLPDKCEWKNGFNPEFKKRGTSLVYRWVQDIKILVLGV